jgi:hypothetical protein
MGVGTLTRLQHPALCLLDSLLHILGVSDQYGDIISWVLII